MHVTSADPGGVVTFGVFELDRRNRQLRREGRPLRLQEQPFQVLALLLEHPGDLVSRRGKSSWEPEKTLHAKPQQYDFNPSLSFHCPV